MMFDFYRQRDSGKILDVSARTDRGSRELHARKGARSKFVLDRAGSEPAKSPSSYRLGIDERTRTMFVAGPVGLDPY